MDLCEHVVPCDPTDTPASLTTDFHRRRLDVQYG